MIVEFSDGPRVGRRGARLPLIFRPNWGPKSRKNNSLRPPPPPLPPYDRAPLIWGTGSDIGIINKYSPILTRFWYYRIFKSFRKRRIIFSLSAMRFIPYLAFWWFPYSIWFCFYVDGEVIIKSSQSWEWCFFSQWHRWIGKKNWRK